MHKFSSRVCIFPQCALSDPLDAARVLCYTEKKTTEDDMKERIVTDNYEAWCEQWRARFLAMEQPELLRRLPELRADEENLHIRHFGREFLVHRRSGQITAADGRRIALNEKLNIYTLFGYVRPNARLTGEWVKFDDLKDASPFSKAFQNGVTTPFARTFRGQSDALRAAAQKLGGKPLPHGDVGFELAAFECIPLRFFFWDADEDFPAQGNLLFDRSATDFIHVESIVTIASIGLRRLAEAAALPIDRSAFAAI